MTLEAPAARVADIVDAIDAVVPFSKAGGWDPVGLQLGDPTAAVASIGVCHEVTGAVVAAAAERSMDLVVSYHPLLFAATRRMVVSSSPSGRATSLLRNGVSLVVVHTAFDAAPGGVADALADALGLTATESFGPNYGSDSVKLVTFVPADSAAAVVGAMASQGAGVIGQYSEAAFTVAGEGTFRASERSDPTIGRSGEHVSTAELRIEMAAPATAADRVVAALVAAHPYEEAPYDIYDHRGNAGFIGRRGGITPSITLAEFVERVAERLACEPRVAGDPARLVSSAAVIPGSGRSFLPSAGSSDVVVTGDVGHHDARSALDRGQVIIDPGHAASERPGVARLYSLIAEIASPSSGVEVVDLTNVDADPWSATWRR